MICFVQNSQVLLQTILKNFAVYDVYLISKNIILLFKIYLLIFSGT
jgi:hypothetical protein